MCSSEWSSCINTGTVRSSDSNLRPFSTAKLLQPQSQPDSSTANRDYFHSPAQSAQWTHLKIPSFGIDAGHGIGSQARPDYFVVPWTSGADFHTPRQRFVSQNCSARNFKLCIARTSLAPRLSTLPRWKQPARHGNRRAGNSRLGGNSRPVKEKGS